MIWKLQMPLFVPKSDNVKLFRSNARQEKRRAMGQKYLKNDFSSIKIF